MHKEYIKPECGIFRLKSRKMVCTSAMGGGYGNIVGNEGEAGGCIYGDDIIDGGSF